MNSFPTGGSIVTGFFSHSKAFDTNIGVFVKTPITVNGTFVLNAKNWNKVPRLICLSVYLHFLCNQVNYHKVDSRTSSDSSGTKVKETTSDTWCYGEL